MFKLFLVLAYVVLVGATSVPTGWIKHYVDGTFFVPGNFTEIEYICTLDTVELATCLNVSINNINIWRSVLDNYMITPVNISDFNPSLWLCCLEEQDLSAIVGVCGSGYSEDYQLIPIPSDGSQIRWLGYRIFVDMSDTGESLDTDESLDKRNCC